MDIKTETVQKKPEDIRHELQAGYKKAAGNIFISDRQGYWSNLDKDESRRLADISSETGPRAAVRKHYPQFFNVIFSPKRQGGLELLDLSGEESCVDYGCMWGAMTIPLAKRCGYVLGVDQTLDSLRFLSTRLKEEKLDNVDLLCSNLKSLGNFRNKFDVALVNGVLEWIPESGDIELKRYYGQYKPKEYSGPTPGEQQLAFLKTVHRNLNDGGRIYLAIENRFDFKMFLGAKEPHSNLFFVSFLPRKAADWISKIKLGRPFTNWLYSFKGIKKVLEESGFSRVELYMCFPDYRYPERIIPYGGSLKDFTPTISPANDMGRKSYKRFLARIGEFAIFGILRLKFFAPSIIAIGHK
ncbi:MAG: class I SAM-dependent methyltransferase [Candidatus Omnitrophica bacterium]|nr:class I SAM-dependent methyltransferase [Candidatus Omnitrophota bacterium]